MQNAVCQHLVVNKTSQIGIGNSSQLLLNLTEGIYICGVRLHNVPWSEELREY